MSLNANETKTMKIKIYIKNLSLFLMHSRYLHKEIILVNVMTS